MSSNDIFSPDFDDGFDEAMRRQDASGAAPKPRATYTCTVCDGRGKIDKLYGRMGYLPKTCPGCKGKGTFKTSPQERAKGRAAAAKTKENKLARAWETFCAQHPEDSAWIAGRMDDVNFTFPGAMYEAVRKYGHLTEKQHATVTRLRLADEQRAKERAAAAATPAATIDASGLLEPMRNAKDRGLKRVRLIIGDLVFSLAGDNSKNPGCVYVKAGTDFEAPYYGKITPAGEFFKVRTTTDETVQAIIKAAEDPLTAAKLHGKETGQCSCCGRRLTNPDSIAAGIGPICESKFF